MTNEERMHLAALCKSAAEDTEGAASDLLSRASAALSLPEPGIVTRDDVDAAIGELGAIAGALESLRDMLAPLLQVIGAEAARMQAQAKAAKTIPGR